LYYNNTIINSSPLFSSVHTIDNTNLMTNNIILTTAVEGTNSSVYDSNLFYGGFAAKGTNQITTNPSLTVSFVPTATLTSIDVTPIASVKLDYNRNLRNATLTTVGAVAHAEESGTVNSILGAPFLTNFKTDPTSTNKIYFDSSEDITGTNVTGFSVSYRTVQSVVINAGSTTGHYLTVNTPLTYWDNNTIDYAGGSNIVDADEANALLPFTYEWVENLIAEPDAPNTKYASPNGGGTHDGSSEANAWSFAEMDNSASAGDHVWVKAGTATGTLFFTKSGTVSNPIVYEGYKTTPGDINSNYLKGAGYGDWNDTEMPTIVGTSRLSDRGWEIRELNYVIFRNFQIRECRYGIIPTQLTEDVSNGQYSNVIFENINGKDFGNSDVQTDLAGYFFNGNGTDPDLAGTLNSRTRGNKIQFKNCVAFNFSQTGILTMGDNWLFDGLEFHSTLVGNKSEVDYNVDLQGDHNVVINSSFRRYDGSTGTGGGFGVSIKARWPQPSDTNGYPGTPTSRYNLVADSYMEGLSHGVNFRWRNCEYNVVKRCQLDGGIQPAGGGVAFIEGASYNIFENNIISNPNDNWYGAISFHDGAEDGYGTAQEQDIVGNVIRNTLIIGGSAYEEATVPAINFGNGRNQTNATAAWVIQDFRIENCTFVNIPEMYNLNSGTGAPTLTNFEFTNNIVVDIPIRNSTNTPTIDETYSVYWNFWGSNGTPPAGVGNISVNPLLDGTNKPTATFTTIDVPPITTIKQDYLGNVRNTTLTTAGWKIHGDEIP